jgi:hypothetical protein
MLRLHSQKLKHFAFKPVSITLQGRLKKEDELILRGIISMSKVLLSKFKLDKMTNNVDTLVINVDMTKKLHI